MVIDPSKMAIFHSFFFLIIFPIISPWWGLVPLPPGPAAAPASPHLHGNARGQRRRHLGAKGSSRGRLTRNVLNIPRFAAMYFSYNIYGYGSIPINTIFSGMNIHLPAILMFTRGTRF
jgi:hypothetical protein